MSDTTGFVAMAIGVVAYAALYAVAFTFMRPAARAGRRKWLMRATVVVAGYVTGIELLRHDWIAAAIWALCGALSVFSATYSARTERSYREFEETTLRAMSRWDHQ